MLPTEPRVAVLGLNPGVAGFNYHDPSAALLVDGQLVFACEEEKFTRAKSSPGRFPRQSLADALKCAKARQAQVAAVAVGYSPARARERHVVQLARAGVKFGVGRPDADVVGFAGAAAEIARERASWDDTVAAARLRPNLTHDLDGVPIDFVEHHLAHAASAAAMSGFTEATVVVLDGVGEVTAASTWLWRRGRLTRVSEDTLPNSIGYFYAAVTAYLGFSPWSDEGKVMALAPYGREDKRIEAVFVDLVRANGADRAFDVGDFVLPCLGDGLSLDVDRARWSLASLIGVPPRPPDEPLRRVHKSVARSAQLALERAAVSYTLNAINSTGNPYLCLAGGVFLNCRLNMVLRDRPEVRSIFVQPVAKDSGVAVGAALVASSIRSGTESVPLTTLGLGRRVDSVAERLRDWGIAYRPVAPELVAALLEQGKIVLFVDGAVEFGPRALGHRSILADPRSRRSARYVNRQVKHRETWRPFGPSIMADHASRILEGPNIGPSAPYMIEAYALKPQWRQRLAGVCHPVDHTVRPHLVTPDREPLLYTVLDAFYRLTGVPALLNTSLNGPGEPIRESLRDVLAFLYTSGAHALVIDEWMVLKGGDASEQ